MTIKSTFKFGGDIIETIVDGNNLLFHDSHSQMTTSIEGLKLSKVGIIEEFPDLKDNPEWKKEAIKRFKKYMKEMKTDTEKNNYVKKELSKHGYEGLFWQRAGHRPQKFK